MAHSFNIYNISLQLINWTWCYSFLGFLRISITATWMATTRGSLWRGSFSIAIQEKYEYTTYPPSALSDYLWFMSLDFYYNIHSLSIYWSTNYFLWVDLLWHFVLHILIIPCSSILNPWPHSLLKPTGRVWNNLHLTEA